MELGRVEVFVTTCGWNVIFRLDRDEEAPAADGSFLRIDLSADLQVPF